MYKISRDRRKYSPTPIVWVDEKGKETNVLFAPNRPGDGNFFDRLRETNAFLEKLTIHLNK